MNRPLITTDCHISPPLTLADEMPEQYRKFIPHLEERADGIYLVRPNMALEANRGNINRAMEGTETGMMMGQMLAEGIKVDPEDEVTLARLIAADCCTEANPGFTAEHYTTELARDGVVGAVLIGGVEAFGNTDDLDGDIAWARLVNDWLHDTFKNDLHRFAPGISLPLSDVSATVNELERAAGLGLRPALIPDVFPSRPYIDPTWEPLWEAAAGLNIPITTHVTSERSMMPWSAETANVHGQGATTAFALVSVGGLETIAWFANSGILERHPHLKVVLTECGAGWLAWAAHFFDQHWSGRFGNEFLTKQGLESMKKTSEPPSFYIKRQVSCTFMDDPVAIHNREFTGLDCLMWSNDYPHEEGIFPNSQALIDKQFAGVPEDEVMQIVHDNAAAVFGLSV